jgi:hypothetical protein
VTPRHPLQGSRPSWRWSLSAVCCLLSAVYCVLSTACCLLCAVCFLLSTACCLLPAACCLLPAAGCLPYTVTHCRRANSEEIDSPPNDIDPTDPIHTINAMESTTLRQLSAHYGALLIPPASTALTTHTILTTRIFNFY